MASKALRGVILPYAWHLARDPFKLLVFLLMFTAGLLRWFAGISLLDAIPIWSIIVLLLSCVLAEGFFYLELIPYEVARLARRLSTTPLESPLDLKGEFVLYLRTFRTDRRAAKFQFGDRDGKLPRDACTEEELLFLTMRRAYGEVVALGDPRERLPQLGARRLYVKSGGGRWKKTVEDLASRASLVLVQLKEGEYTEWELKHVAANKPLEQIALLVPRRTHELDFLQRTFGYFSASPNLAAVYREHVAALYESEIRRLRHGEPVRQTEYFSVVCFDRSNVAHRDSVMWDEKYDFASQNLVKALALQTLFRLNNHPSHGDVSMGLGSWECCARPLTKDHPGMYCTKTDTECSMQNREELRWRSIRGVGWGPDLCCPQCLRERRRGSSNCEISDST
ncbi:hypothetical protein [Streptomyces sp. NRRL S-37]|uniref:hypothetical protein n=1 Tax=Streptomyces sp. NRRL S-37 TaxID=1463903 RepID=UPI00131ECA0B|nr:hypothetical protein [Streptomyces sp. NRRL S-37]